MIIQMMAEDHQNYLPISLNLSIPFSSFKFVLIKKKAIIS